MSLVFNDKYFLYSYEVRDNIVRIFDAKRLQPCSNLTLPAPQDLGVSEVILSRGYGGASSLTGFKKVAIPEGYVEIGAGAFQGSSVEEVFLPEGIKKIHGDAFSNSKLRAINLPRSLTHVDSFAFERTPMVENESLWVNNVFYIDDWALMARDDVSSTSSDKNDCTINIKDGTRGISSSFTWRMEKRETNVHLTLPETLETIGDYAFYSCKLTDVKLPDSLKLIGVRAFSFTSLKDVFVGEKCKEIGSGAFAGCPNLKTAEVKGIETVETNTFSWCRSLEQVKMPAVKVVKKCAFLYSNKIDVSLPSSVERVGASAFEVSITSSQTLTLPRAAYAKTAFRNRLFDKLTINSLVSQGIAEKAKSLIVKGVKTVRAGYCSGSDTLETIIFDESVSLIRDDAFAMCPNLKEVYVMNEGAVIEPMAFYGSPVNITQKKGG